MLRLDRLTLEQGDFRMTADLSLPQGSVTAVMGPSGGGKSTLLAAIAGFITPRSGRVLCDGRDLTPMPPGDRPVAMLFQDNNLFPHLTVAQNVGLALAPRLRLSAQDAARVSRALDEVGLTGMGDRRPAALSGGQQGRAALARTLLMDRAVVLLDEPFSALGPGLRAEMLDLATATLRTAGRTMVLVTHDPDDAARVANLTVVIDGGIAEGPFDTAALLADPPPGLRDYLGT